MEETPTGWAPSDIQEDEAPKRRGRPPRKEAVKRDRRRRNSALLNGTQQTLEVDREIREQYEGEYELRWINDDSKGRLHAKTNDDDWEIVKGKDGENIAKRAGLQSDGSKALHTYLCRKPKDWCAADRAEKDAILDRQVSELKRGSSSDPNSIQATGQAYVPEGWAPKVDDGSARK